MNLQCCVLSNPTHPLPTPPPFLFLFVKLTFAYHLQKKPRLFSAFSELSCWKHLWPLKLKLVGKQAPFWSKIRRVWGPFRYLVRGSRCPLSLGGGGGLRNIWWVCATGTSKLSPLVVISTCQKFDTLSQIKHALPIPWPRLNGLNWASYIRWSLPKVPKTNPWTHIYQCSRVKISCAPIFFKHIGSAWNFWDMWPLTSLFSLLLTF